MTDDATEGTTGTAETHEFRAETRQLLDLMIHSVYSNPDTFLRELISNSSDALDKLRIAALTEDLGVDTSDLHIELTPDSAARTLTVADNGIGMSREEVVDLIGTLARSGTAQVREALLAAQRVDDGEGGASTSEQAAAELIGQFGIGFYSTFMVADRVTLVTRRAGQETGTRWESSGDGTYTVEELASAPQGTAITLHLKPTGGDSALPDYTSEHTLRTVVRTYSDFIAWPIRMEVERPAPADESADDGDDAAAPTTIREQSVLNSQKALWTRPRSEVSDEEYAEFYRHIAHAWDSPLETMTLKAEGTFEYQALLFLPSQAPMDFFTPDQRRGVQLYVRRVFIMDDCAELVPPYLRFVKGVVDAQDLSLNVSREILQQDRQIRAIRKRLVKKVMQTIAQLRRDEPEKFETFWGQFGAVLKEGLIPGPDGAENTEQILDVAVFDSVQGETEHCATTLAQYVERTVEGQPEIYYLTGRTRAAVENSPHLEGFRARGVEVLLLTDPVDEVWVDAVGEFDGRPLRSIAKGDVDLENLGGAADGSEGDGAGEKGEKGGASADDDAAEKDGKKGSDSADTPDAEAFAPLLTWLGETLGDRIKQARLSHRLTTSAACLVGERNDMTPQLEAMYRASGMDVPTSKRILELNPTHPAVTRLRQAQAEDPEAAADTARLLLGAATLAEGGTLDDPAAFARLLAERL